MRIVWFAAFVSTICLEGLGRKYLPEVPGPLFYFGKDLILLIGAYLFWPSPALKGVASYLFRGFKVVLLVGIIFTVAEALVPGHRSSVLAVLGLRAYWLWWFAPIVVASVLQERQHKKYAIYVLLVISTAVSILAALQFAAPADSAWNLYSVVNGEEVYAKDALVYSTGRPRVASTFSYISGFAAFSALIPALLLSIGLDARDRGVRWSALLVTCITAAVVPMSGSRSSIVYGIINLATTAWVAGLFVTRIGRRVMVGGVAAALVAVVVFPDAFFGVQSRFADTEETNTRYALVVASVVPPVALATFDYPMVGIGTGMMQNAHYSMNIDTYGWDGEIESARILIELGPVGFLIVWTAKLGLVVGLLRAYALLKRAGRRGASAAALSFSFMTLVGNLVFDHIWQALFFVGCGFILSEVASVVRSVPVLTESLIALTSRDRTPLISLKEDAPQI